MSLVAPGRPSAETPARLLALEGWSHVAAACPSYEHFLLQEFCFGTWRKAITNSLHFCKDFRCCDLMDCVNLVTNGYQIFQNSELRFEYKFSAVGVVGTTIMQGGVLEQSLQHNQESVMLGQIG